MTSFSKWISLNKKNYILIQISLKFVPYGLMEIKLSLTQIMDFRRTGGRLTKAYDVTI